MKEEQHNLFDQCIEQALAHPDAGLGRLAAEPGMRELCAAFDVDSPEALDEMLQLTGSATMLASLPAPAESMPGTLRAKLIDGSKPYVKPQAASVTSLDTARTRAANNGAGRRFPWSAGLGWAAAAALLLALIITPGRERIEQPATAVASIAEQREDLRQQDGTLVIEWLPPEIEEFADVRGDVVWNNEQQRGFLRLVNMPVNEPTVAQYQLWIVDPERDSNPVDGGVFDVVTAGTEVLIPIDAKLDIITPKAFAITRERPGGVVVSAGPLLVVAAS